MPLEYGGASFRYIHRSGIAGFSGRLFSRVAVQVFTSTSNVGVFPVTLIFSFFFSSLSLFFLSFLLFFFFFEVDQLADYIDKLLIGYMLKKTYNTKFTKIWFLPLPFRTCPPPNTHHHDLVRTGLRARSQDDQGWRDPGPCVCSCHK